MRLQLWRAEECGVHLHCHYSLVHPDKKEEKIMKEQRKNITMNVQERDYLNYRQKITIDELKCHKNQLINKFNSFNLDFNTFSTNATIRGAAITIMLFSFFSYLAKSMYIRCFHFLSSIRSRLVLVTSTIWQIMRWQKSQSLYYSQDNYIWSDIHYLRFVNFRTRTD